MSEMDAFKRMLDNHVEQTAQQFNTKLDELRIKIDELTELKARLEDHTKGLGRATIERRAIVDRIDKLEERIGVLVDRQGRLKSRVTNLGEFITDTQMSAINTELGRLNRQAEVYASDAQAEISRLDGRIDILSSAHESTASRVDEVQYRMDSDDTAVEVQGFVNNTARWGIALICGVLMAIIAGLATDAMFDDWTTFRSVGFGLLIGLAVMFLIASFETSTVEGKGKIKWATRKQTPELESPKAEPIDVPADDTAAIVVDPIHVEPVTVVPVQVK